MRQCIMSQPTRNPLGRGANPEVVNAVPGRPAQVLVPFVPPRRRAESAGVIGRIRRILRDIDYHSARRQRSRWSVASDLWLLASLPAAVGIAALLAGSVHFDATTTLLVGSMTRGIDGRLSAVFTKPGESASAAGTFVGGVEVRQRVESRGWPLAMWVQEHQPEVLVSDGVTTKALSLSGFDDTVSAVRVGLRLKHPSVAQQCSAPSVRQVRYGALTTIIAITWIALIPLGLIVIQLMRFGAGVINATAESRKSMRRARGLCPHCGYETRGLEFAPACPECGQLLS